MNQKQQEKLGQPVFLGTDKSEVIEFVEKYIDLINSKMPDDDSSQPFKLAVMSPAIYNASLSDWLVSQEQTNDAYMSKRQKHDASVLQFADKLHTLLSRDGEDFIINQNELKTYCFRILNNRNLTNSSINSIRDSLLSCGFLRHDNRRITNKTLFEVVISIDQRKEAFNMRREALESEIIGLKIAIKDIDLRISELDQIKLNNSQNQSSVEESTDVIENRPNTDESDDEDLKESMRLESLNDK
jgi:hypothetical protein